MTTVEEARKYFCRRCGAFLCESTIPLGTEGVTVFHCHDSRCGKVNPLKLGEEPLPRPDRERWLRELHALRRRGTTF